MAGSKGKLPKPDRCAGTTRRRDAISLPVVATEHGPTGTIRKSRSGRRRALVLAAVQLAMIAHVIQWLIWGRTTTPIEPSEAMEAVKNGVINAGFVFFAVALLSTLILGRWFCGWGCHLVMLQDLCSWMMKKLGIRPKAFRSRLLVYVPLLLALYMFVWPLFYRLAVAPWLQPRLHWPGFKVELVSSHFWETFPTVLVAIPFLLICGFATVYFLGAKGFCTYGCPYGGFFAPLDEFAVGRIRVTDACEQCGHCTAVCTSNVRVHEEVREYGMVVDPGCMKCQDCVSVCPNDALYFGIGRPAILKGPARTKAPRRTYDLTIGEEVFVAAAFALVFFSVRGVYELVPMLMAGGVAGCVTFLLWKAWRLLRDDSVRLHGFQFKLKGRLRPAGWWLAAITASIAALVVHSGVVNAAHALAGRFDQRVTIPLGVVFSDTPMQMGQPMRRSADRAIALYAFASVVGDGGIGLAPSWQDSIDVRLAWLHSATLDFGAAEKFVHRAIERRGQTEALAVNLFWVIRSQGRRDDARAYAEAVLAEEPGFTELGDELVRWLEFEGHVDEAIARCRVLLAQNPNSLLPMRRLSLLLVQHDDAEAGIELIRRTIRVEPGNPHAHHTLALALIYQGRPGEAYESLRRALALAPDSPGANADMAKVLDLLDRSDEATPFHRRAEQLRQEQARPRSAY